MRRIAPVIAGLALLLMLGSACATKKYVRKTVDTRLTPVEGRVGELEETSRRTSQELKDLDARLSGRIEEVNKTAERANAEAQQASQRAARADEHAAQADEHATKVEQKVDVVAERAENVENYALSRTVTINFKVGSAKLDPKGTADLDALAAGLTSQKGYVLEVQGFTDSTGSANANRALSQRRADAVQTYLVEHYNIPLYRVRMIGLGEDKPVAGNNSRTGRAQNRRVEVRLLTNGGGKPSKANGE
ncbi:MAG TPA: OmpA family protein [Blastocatellia bacterium]|nr:OmpA family protein [Blastocatellia bacterium]